MININHIKNTYVGSDLFIIGSGASFTPEIASFLRDREVTTMGINNSVKSFKPTLWCGVDPPCAFVPSLWKDPSITKFTIEGHSKKEIDGKLLGTFPSIFGFRWNVNFDPENFLSETTVNYGGKIDGEEKGARSAIIASLKVAYFLGFKRVFLLGVDFDMKVDLPNYSFDQKTSDRKVGAQNTAYEKLNKMLNRLQPKFCEKGFQVYNCNPESKLTAFPIISLADATALAKSEIYDMSREEVPRVSDWMPDRRKGDKSKSEPNRYPDKVNITIIAGCEKSGTSLIAGLFHASSIYGGSDKGLKIYKDHNPKGCFENQRTRSKIFLPYLKEKGWGRVFAVPKEFEGKSVDWFDKSLHSGAHDFRNRILDCFVEDGWDGKQPLFLKFPPIVRMPYEISQAFPKARWVVVRSRDQDTMMRRHACGFTKETPDKNGKFKVDEILRHANESLDQICDKFGADEIWPERVIGGDLVKIKKIIEIAGGEWNDELAGSFMEKRLYWKNL